MIPGTRPLRRVSRAAPLPARARRSALRVVISGMNWRSFFAGAGIVGRCKVSRRGQYQPDGGCSRLSGLDNGDTQLNRLETERSSLIRRIASPISGAIVSWRILWAARTASVATMLSVIASVAIGDAATRGTAGPDSTP